MKAIVLSLALLLTAEPHDRQTVIVVVGAAGTEQYGRQFRAWAARWERAARKADATFIPIGQDDTPGGNDRQRLQQQLAAARNGSDETLWLVLIGHGTFDGRSAKFNLRGPDVTAAQLAEWLKPCTRPLAVINCSSASAPFLNRLSGPDRVIVTATKSGYEYNYARFGDYLSSAITDQAADLDKDQQTSLLEAFLAASAQVEEFYSQHARLATEHALIDDNGDALGTLASWFRGVRAIRTAKDGAAPDGLRANQFHLVRSPREQKMPPGVRARRDRLELEVARLRERKETMGQEEYYNLLETLLVQLAQLYEELETPWKETDERHRPAAAGGDQRSAGRDSGPAAAPGKSP